MRKPLLLWPAEPPVVAHTAAISSMVTVAEILKSGQWAVESSARAYLAPPLLPATLLPAHACTVQCRH